MTASKLPPILQISLVVQLAMTSIQWSLVWSTKELGCDICHATDAFVTCAVPIICRTLLQHHILKASIFLPPFSSQNISLRYLTTDTVHFHFPADTMTTLPRARIGTGTRGVGYRLPGSTASCVESRWTQRHWANTSIRRQLCDA